MNPLMANGRGMGWPRSVQVLVQIVWTLNPTLTSFSGCDQSLEVSPCDWLRIGFSCRCPPSARLCMDVFVAVCFYPPDLFPPLVMAPVYYEIKEWNILVYVLPSSLVWSSMWLLLYSLFMSAPVLHISSAYGQSMKSPLCFGLQCGFSNRCLFSIGLCMDVFVAAHFYLPDFLFFPEMVFITYEIKEWSCLCYVFVCSLVWFTLWMWPKNHILVIPVFLWLSSKSVWVTCVQLLQKSLLLKLVLSKAENEKWSASILATTGKDKRCVEVCLWKKKYLSSTDCRLQSENLTGAHGEPRQEP